MRACLKRLNTYLSDGIGQDRKNKLELLTIKRDKSSKIDLKAVDKFAQQTKTEKLSLTSKKVNDLN